MGAHYRCKQGELDLVMRDADTVVFVKYVTRRTYPMGQCGRNDRLAQTEALIAQHRHLHCLPTPILGQPALRSTSITARQPSGSCFLPMDRESIHLLASHDPYGICNTDQASSLRTALKPKTRAMDVLGKHSSSKPIDGSTAYLKRARSWPAAMAARRVMPRHFFLELLEKPLRAVSAPGLPDVH